MSARFDISRPGRRWQTITTLCGAFLFSFLYAPLAMAGGAANAVVTFSTAPLSSGAVTTGQDAALNGVSCSGLNTCVAVGSFRTPAGNQLLISNEVNAVWSAGPRIVLPHDAVSSWAHAPAPITQFSSISCTSLGNCVAVGTYLTTSGFEPLIDVESSGVWSAATRAVLPTNSASTQQLAELFSVSCASTGNCQAVGTYSETSGGQLPLVIEENASVWSKGFEPSLPVGALSVTDQVAELTSVSCWSVANCAAVGAFVNAQGFETMVLNEANAKWAPSSGAYTVSLPANAASAATAYGNALNAISCSSAEHCVAVGDYLTSGAYSAMASTGSATTWAPATALSTPSLPSASGEIDASLNSVSCTDATWCVALGAVGSSQTRSPLTAVFSGTTFGDPVLGSVPSDSAASLVASTSGAACFASNDCVVVGAYVTGAHGTQGFVGTPTTVPVAPTALSGIAGNQSIHLQWSSPVYGGGLAITGYVVSATPGSATCSTNGATSCTIGALTNGVSYRFRVVARNSLGTSVPSVPSAPLIPRTVPNAPSIKSVTALVGALKLIVLAPTSNGGVPITSYQYSITAGKTWHVRASGTTSSILVVNGLSRHHNYWVAVRAMNAAGPSPASKVVKATTR